ncbi:hypothetical protein HDU76_010821, partial [Blyttiomyces sp. JEL0837]
SLLPTGPVALNDSYNGSPGLITGGGMTNNISGVNFSVAFNGLALNAPSTGFRFSADGPAVASTSTSTSTSTSISESRRVPELGRNPRMGVGRR